MVAEVVRKLVVSWLRSLPPEAQATIVIGILTVVVQPLLIVLTFLLGKAQGKAQMRHEKAAESVVATVRVVRKLRTELGMWAIMRERDETEAGYREKVRELRGELRELVYQNAAWLDPRTERKLKPVVYELADRCNEHGEALASGDKAQAEQTGARLSKWNMRNLTQIQLDLEDEARRLIGTKRRWSLTWWGRPLAWFTRTTRFFSVLKWIRRNTGWLLAVPLPILVEIGVLVYVLS